MRPSIAKPRRRLFTALPCLILVLAFLMPSDNAYAASPGHGDTIKLCFVLKRHAGREHTINVPQRIADRLISHTLSYKGPCASYGDSAPLGKGTATAYSQTYESGKPLAVGLIFADVSLAGLPKDPPTDGKYCYDKDGDGDVDPMMECSNGYGSMLNFSHKFRSSVDTPFTYLLLNWNPMGHMPPGVYDKPHFDVHFYMNENSERLGIRTGPCGELVNCDDYKLGKNLPAHRYYPPGYQDTDAVAPAMGNHLINTDGPEFHGKPFTHTWIFGSWDSEITYYEPMITKQWYDDLRTGERPNGCFTIPRPDAVRKSGWYPTKYCMKRRDNRHELTTSLENFEYRMAS